MNVLLEKFKEVLMAVLPITLLVVVINFIVSPIIGAETLSVVMLLRFILGSIFIFVGLTIFLFGVDIGITPLGNNIGSSFTKSNKLWIIIAAGLIVGFFVSIAEPDLMILADQVESVTGGLITRWSILIVVSVGIGVMLSAGLSRILHNIPINLFLLGIYAIILILSFFVSPDFLAIAFDASGATTGALAVPFILAFATGVSSMKKDSLAAEEDSFGLVGVTSTGAILGVLIMGIVTKTGEISGTVESLSDDSGSIIKPFLKLIPEEAWKSFISLLPLVVIFIVMQIFVFKLHRRACQRILKGLLYAFVGLVIFLTGVNAGFMEVGSIVGHNLASLDNKAFIVIIGFVLGLVTILAEPAVYVLVRQIEDVTSGHIKRGVVMIALAIGVAAAVGLSMLRIVIPGIQLWHFLLPGYIISVILSFIVPKIFVGIAFDSGGVASGPMTATFILAFAKGAADAVQTADVLRDSFGVIAMVAMMPIIALQILGFVYKIKSKKKGGEVNGAI